MFADIVAEAMMDKAKLQRRLGLNKPLRETLTELDRYGFGLQLRLTLRSWRVRAGMIGLKIREVAGLAHRKN
jgi:hypothetical protein